MSQITLPLDIKSLEVVSQRIVNPKLKNQPLEYAFVTANACSGRGAVDGAANFITDPIV